MNENMHHGNESLAGEKKIDNNFLSVSSGHTRLCNVIINRPNICIEAWSVSGTYQLTGEYNISEDVVVGFFFVNGPMHSFYVCISWLRDEKKNATSICLYVLHQQKRCIAIDLFFFLCFLLDMETLKYNHEKASLCLSLSLWLCWKIDSLRSQALNLTAFVYSARE